MIKTIAKIISVVFHPLLMVTYGMMLVFSFTYLAVFPTQLKWLIIGGLFMCTVIVPGLFILLMMRMGIASDFDLTNRKERAVPYLTILVSILTCIFYLYRMKLPFWLTDIFIGVFVALFLALCINYYWKISAHAIGIGGLLGAVLGVSRMHMINPYWGFMTLFLVVGLVCSSRIYLEKHTPLQTYAGVGLGFICTFTASLYRYFYLFI